MSAVEVPDLVLTAARTATAPSRPGPWGGCRHFVANGNGNGSGKKAVGEQAALKGR